MNSKLKMNSKDMEPNSVPGIDGFTIAWLRTTDRPIKLDIEAPLMELKDTGIKKTLRSTPPLKQLCLQNLAELPIFNTFLHFLLIQLSIDKGRHRTSTPEA